MKNLIFVNGTMGAGKTATCTALRDIMKPAVFLDGDWCWDMRPFTVTEETKHMVLDNICYLLGNFIACSEYKNIICFGIRKVATAKTSARLTVSLIIIQTVFFNASAAFSGFCPIMPQYLDTSTDAPIPRPIQKMW